MVGLEAMIEFVLRFPGAVPFLYRPARPANHLKNYYLGFDRSAVQLRRDCATYDEVLTYRLRPGTCTVRNREGVVEYSVNRAGLRDAEGALLAPSVIVLGDSQAMGWNVSAEAALPTRIAAHTGRLVLNAAISSYETAREMALLREVVRPSTEFVVIAYCDNDADDNWHLVATGALPHLDRPNYERVVADHERRVRYLPFKHIWRLGGLVLGSMRGGSAASTPSTKPGFAAMNFLAILDASVDLLRGRHVIVFEVNSYNANSPRFANAVRQAAARLPLLTELASLHVVDTSSFLTDDDYFLIDDHLNPRGHDQVARRLAEVINGGERWRVRPVSERAEGELGGAREGSIDVVERKGVLTVIQGWAARRDTGEPAATVALLRDGAKLIEAEPVFVRPDVASALGRSAAGASGFALAIRTDRVTDWRSVQVVAFWPNGGPRLLEHQQRIREPSLAR
jgi:hypothetical protein